MVQTIRHGIGKEDHVYTTIKGLPMADRECQLKFGFENMDLVREFQTFSQAERVKIFEKALDDIRTYLSTSNQEYILTNHDNFITVQFKEIPEAKRKDFGIIIYEIFKQIDKRILNFRFNQDYYNTGRMKITFHIKNCGFIPEEKNVMTKSQNVITNHDNMSSQNGSEKEKMSSQNQNVITKEKKEKFIHLRISTSNKTKIQEKAKREGYTSVSKYIIDMMTDRKNVITPQENINKDVMTDKEHILLIELIKIFIKQDIIADLSDPSIEILKKIVEEEDLD